MNAHSEKTLQSKCGRSYCLLYPKYTMLFCLWNDKQGSIRDVCSALKAAEFGWFSSVFRVRRTRGFPPSISALTNSHKRYFLEKNMQTLTVTIFFSGIYKVILARFLLLL